MSPGHRSRDRRSEGRPAGPPLLAVQHEDDDPPALFGDWLEEAGVDLDVRRCDLGDPLPTTLDGFAGLLVMGGEMGAYDDADHGWLTPTKALIRNAVASGLPSLGICLGHQLAAVALGGTVSPHPVEPQIGVFDVGWTPAADSDPLVGELARAAADGGPPTPAVQWNNDVVSEAPPGSTLLACAPDGAVQALRFGPRAWGLQSHPEVGRDLVSRWAQSNPAVAVPLDSIGAAEARLKAAWHRVALSFADQLAVSRTLA